MKLKCFRVLAGSLLISGILSGNALAGDLDDDISKYKDDAIQTYDDLGKPDTNISFIVSDALGDAKVWEYAVKKEEMAEGTEEAKKKGKQRDKGNINLNDGSGDSNEDSIVIGTGSKVEGPIININMEK